MRCTGILPFLCAITAFVLALLCVFAGSNPGFLEDAHIVTLNASDLGHDLPKTSSLTGPECQGILCAVKNATSSVVQGIEGTAGNIINSLAAEIGIHQFYSLHLMDYCEGFYQPNATAPHASKNVTHCSNKTAMYHFNITKIISEELKVGISLSDLKWPNSLQKGLDALNKAEDAAFVLYMMGIVTAGLAILSAPAFFLYSGRLVSVSNFGLTILSFLFLGMASAIITVIMTKAVHIINKYGNGIGLSAYKGNKYLAMTWSATAVMLVASLAWLAECCVGRRQRDKLPIYFKKQYT